MDSARPPASGIADGPTDRRTKPLVALVLVAAACGCANDGQGGAAGEATNDLECEEQGFPCTWAEVAPEVAGRTFDLAAAGVELLEETGSLEEVAAMLGAEAEIGELLGDGRALRFWLRGGRPVWIADREAAQPGTRGFGGGGWTDPPAQQVPNDVPGTQRSDVGEPDPTPPTKKALVLSPYEWEFKDHQPTVDALLQTPEFGCSDCVEEHENAFPLNPDMQVEISHFEGWRKFDVIHVSTHGKMLCRTPATVLVTPTGPGVAANLSGPFPCVTFVDTGITYPVTAFRSTFAGWVTRAGSIGLSSTVGEPGVEFLFSPPPKACADLDPVKQKALYDQVHCGEPLQVSVGLSDEFFRAKYPGGLTSKIVFLNACETMLQPNQTLAAHLLSGSTGGPRAAVLGWTIEVDAADARDVAILFYKVLLGHRDSYQVPYRLGVPGPDLVLPPTNDDRILSVEQAADSTIKLLPTRTRGLLVATPSRRIRGEPLPPARRSSGATRSVPSAGGTWGLQGRPEMRAREIVALLHPTGTEIRDRDIVTVRGQPGDGRPDSLDLIFRVRSVLPHQDPGDYVLHLYADGVASDLDERLEARNVFQGVGERRVVVALGSDLAPGEPFDLEPWVELPAGGGISRWVYEDVRAPPPCWFRVTWSGGNVGGTEVWNGPDYPWILGGALFGTGDFLQGEQTLVNIVLDRVWPRPGPGYARLLVPGATFTPETMSLGVKTPNYEMLAGWVLGSRFNPGPAEVRITDVRNGVVEGTATAAMRSKIYAAIPFDPNDPGPNAVNVTVDFRFPLDSGGTADCPRPDDWGPP